jgi:hypothetical protein
MTNDISDMPPVPPDMYETLEALILSDQIPASRLAELLQDETFALWLSSRQRQAA